MKDIYKLKLHETTFLDSSRFGDTKITRVPGGWIYDYTKYTSPDYEESPIAKAAVFVPFNNEFQTEE